MRLAKSIATIFAAVTVTLCFGGVAPAQTNAAAHKPEPNKATSKAVPAASKPAPKPVAKTQTKPVPAKPHVAKAETKPPMAKPAGVKVESKPTVAKAPNTNPGPVKSVAKPAIGKTAISKAERKSSAKPVAKTVAKSVAKPVAPAEAAKKNPVGMTASPDQAPPASHADNLIAKRDPFVALVNVQKEGGGGPNLPPGKAGLVVATVRVDGTVKSGDELLAVVSNPERHVYFVREGDHLYDGSVKKIDLDGVTFQEDSKDAFGKPIVREVTKRIYASAGDAQ